MSVRKTGVIFLQKERLQVYNPLSEAILELQFPIQIVRDLDVIDKENFEVLLKSFIFSNKILPSDFVIVIADNASFMRDFSQGPSDQTQTQQQIQAAQDFFHANLHTVITTFIEHVPFEHVVSKTFTLKNSTRVFATNKDLYDMLQIGFEKQGSSIILVVPDFITGISFGGGMESKSVNLLLQRIPMLRQYNLLEIPMYTPESKPNEEIEEVHVDITKQNKTKRLYALIALFVLLILILIIVVIMNLSGGSPPASKVAQVQSASATATPFSTATPGPSTPPHSSPTSDTQSLSVGILSTSSSAQAGQLLKANLEKFKFKTVTVSQTSIFTQTTIIIFSSRPNPSVRTAVIAEVKKVTTAVTIQYKTDAATDITIIFGQ